MLLFRSPPPPAVYPLSLHDALPISLRDRRPDADGPAEGAADPQALHQRQGLAAAQGARAVRRLADRAARGQRAGAGGRARRSEEHTSELQSQSNLVCRLLLEKKKTR